MGEWLGGSAVFSRLVECGEFFIRQDQFGGRDIFVQVSQLRGAGNRQYHWAAVQQPGQCHLAGTSLVTLCNAVQHSP